MPAIKKRRPKFISHREVMATYLKDPEFRYLYEQRKLIQEVAIAVRGMRQGAGLSQAQLAGMIGVSQPMIARLEKGTDQRTPRWDTLRRIAIALGRQMKLSFVPVERGESEVLVEVDGHPPRLAEDTPAMTRGI